MDKFSLKFVWSEKYLGVSLDQKIGVSRLCIPLTEYFFWPRTDAWDQLHSYLQNKNFITQKEIVIILNMLTDVIHFWQDESEFKKKSISLAKEKFPLCSFVAHD